MLARNHKNTISMFVYIVNLFILSEKMKGWAIIMLLLTKLSNNTIL